MGKNNLRELPKLRDSISYVYVEFAVVEQDDHSLVILRKDGRIPAAFSAVKMHPALDGLDGFVRKEMRNELSRKKLLKKIPEDLEWIFQVQTESEETRTETAGDLWDPSGTIAGGRNWAEGGIEEV